MSSTEDRIAAALEHSRKLEGEDPSPEQRENILFRLGQIFTEAEIERMNQDEFIRQVERVWPIARYVDNPD